MAMPMAAAVAMIIATNPLATHCAKLTASAVLDDWAAWS
jgi:hypothetical protein